MYGIWADTLGSTATSIHVERSVISNNGEGLRITAAAADAVAIALVKQNAFIDSKTSVAVKAMTISGLIHATVTDNIMSDEIVSDGPNNNVSISGNTGNRAELVCINGGTIFTYKNNSIRNLSCPLSPVSGI